MYKECVIRYGRAKTGPGLATEKVKLLYEIIYAASCVVCTLWAKEREYPHHIIIIMMTEDLKPHTTNIFISSEEKLPKKNQVFWSGRACHHTTTIAFFGTCELGLVSNKEVCSREIRNDGWSLSEVRWY